VLTLSTCTRGLMLIYSACTRVLTLRIDWDWACRIPVPKCRKAISTYSFLLSFFFGTGQAVPILVRRSRSAISAYFFFRAGCPNTCAQVQIGDIGLLGTTAKDSNGQVVEAVDIFTGGGIGQNGAIGSIYKKGVPIDEQLEHELSKLLVCALNAKR